LLERSSLTASYQITLDTTLQDTLAEINNGQKAQACGDLTGVIAAWATDSTAAAQHTQAVLGC
jgi:hypothetical protein